jgi:soluble lytic murein transglycosylase-like protein
MPSSRFRLVLPVLLVALGAAPAHADIYVEERPDGTLHVTNVPSRRGRGATTVVRSRDTPGSGPSQVITAEGSPSSGSSAAPAQSAQVRSMYQAAARDPSRYARFDEYIREAAALYQIPEALVRAVIKQESDFNPYSVSSAGAAGLMQLMPSTAESMMVRDVFDPRQSILGGTRFLRILANMFNGDLVLTLAAYNAGPNAVIRHTGVPPYEETQHYVRQVLRYYYTYRAGGGPGQPAVPATAVTPAAAMQP